MEKLYLGVDGGQSGTVALVAGESGEVLGEGRAGPCNHVSTEESRERFRKAIGGAVQQAAAAAGLRDPYFEAACLGLSGGPHDKDALARELIPAARYLITHDAAIALSGALAGEPGVIVIAGTGSIAFGRNAAGETARAGGWGYVFGDEGGGFDLVRQALRAALREEEGWGPPTTLRGALLNVTGASDVNELMHRFYTPEYPRDRIASYAKLIDSAAEAGDAVARDLLRGAAQALAMLAGVVRRGLFSDDGFSDKSDSRVSYTGGVFESTVLRKHFLMLAGLDGCAVQAPQFGPAAGALIEAFRAAGLSLHPSGAPKGV